MAHDITRYIVDHDLFYNVRSRELTLLHSSGYFPSHYTFLMMKGVPNLRKVLIKYKIKVHIGKYDNGIITNFPISVSFDDSKEIFQYETAEKYLDRIEGEKLSKIVDKYTMFCRK